MLYLYLGFLLTQSPVVIKVIYNANIPLLTIAFSIIVFMIWSLFPILGFALGKGVGKLINVKTYCNKYILFTLGCSISIIEQALFHFEILSQKDGYAAMLVTASLFFGAAFVSLSRKQTIWLT